MKLKGKKLFITGGAGFIGSHLCERLVDSNEIVVFDTLSRNALAKTSIEKHKNLRIVKGDVLNADSLVSEMNGCDAVIHMAAIAGVGTVLSKPTTTFKVNLLGSLNVLEAAKKNDVKRIVTFSTSEVYGPNCPNAREDGFTTLGPLHEGRWTYAVSKLASEFLAKGYDLEHGIKFSGIRPFNIYGPRQIGEGAIHNFISNAVNNKPLIIHKPGTQVRAWCYVADMIDALELVLTSKKAEGETFNIGNDLAHCTTAELAKKVVSITKSKSKIESKDVDYPDVNVRIPSVEKAKKLLGFTPKVGLDLGIEKTAQWYSTQ